MLNFSKRLISKTAAATLLILLKFCQNVTNGQKLKVTKNQPSPLTRQVGYRVNPPMAKGEGEVDATPNRFLQVFLENGKKIYSEQNV